MANSPAPSDDRPEAPAPAGDAQAPVDPPGALSVACGACLTPLSAGARYCSGCGGPVGGTPARRDALPPSGPTAARKRQAVLLLAIIAGGGVALVTGVLGLGVLALTLEMARLEGKARFAAAAGEPVNAALHHNQAGALAGALRSRRGLARGLRRAADAARPDLSPAGGVGSWKVAAGLYELEAAAWAGGRPEDRARALESAAYSTAPDQDEPALAWKRAAELYAEAVSAWASAGDPRERAEALWEQARCLEPERAGAEHGSWSEAARLYGQAVEIWLRLGEDQEAAEALDAQAWCVRPDNDGSGGAWPEAARLYLEAAERWDRAGDPAEQAGSLLLAARCLREAGEWSRAGRMCSSAGAVYAKLGAWRDAADAAVDLADSVRPDRDPDQTSWAEPAAAYALAAERYGEAEAPLDVAWSLRMQAWCTLPERAPGQGSWAEARALYAASAAAVEGRADGRRARVLALFQQARCAWPSRDPAGSWAQAAALFGRAADACDPGEDRARLGEALDLQALCLEPVRNPEGSWPEAEAAYRAAAVVWGEHANATERAGSLVQAARCRIAAGAGDEAVREALAEARRAVEALTGEKWLPALIELEAALPR